MLQGKSAKGIPVRNPMAMTALIPTLCLGLAALLPLFEPTVKTVSTHTEHLNDSALWLTSITGSEDFLS